MIIYAVSPNASYQLLFYSYIAVSGEGSPLTPSPSVIPTPAEDDDYVWDVFYSRPATFREFYSSYSNVGTVWVLYGSWTSSFIDVVVLAAPVFLKTTIRAHRAIPKLMMSLTRILTVRTKILISDG